MSNIPLINGRAYEYAQIAIEMLGGNVNSASAISYKEEQTKENNFGAGYRPVSRGHGAVNATASITMGMQDVEALRDVAPDGSLLKLPPFDIKVTYLNLGKVVTHIVKNCEFLDDGVDTSQDDKDIKGTFGLLPSHVKYR